MRAAWFVLPLIAIAAQAEIGRFHKIDDNLYRGRQPSKEQYAELARMGIRTVLDLRGGPLHSPRERRDVETNGMHYLSVRLSGVWEPKDRQIAEILGILEDPSRTPVFVHCHRGADRLGMVIACYRIEHDHWTNREALNEARLIGLNRFEWLMQRYILNFDPGKVGTIPPATDSK
jgi:tyrosine-protein phosphatase SIW14